MNSKNLTLVLIKVYVNTPMVLFAYLYLNLTTANVYRRPILIHWIFTGFTGSRLSSDNDDIMWKKAT